MGSFISTLSGFDVDRFASLTLTCSICRDLFEGDPRMLPCGHTNCTHCLEELRRRGNGTIKCPQCQKPCKDPVTQLPVNFAAKQMVELRKRETARNDNNSNGQNQTMSDVEDDGFQVFVKDIISKTVVLDGLKRQDTVAMVKDMIHQHEGEGHPPEHQRLIYMGKLMEDDKTLEFYNICKSSTIFLGLSLTYGGH